MYMDNYLIFRMGHYANARIITTLGKLKINVQCYVQNLTDYMFYDVPKDGERVLLTFALFSMSTAS